MNKQEVAIYSSHVEFKREDPHTPVMARADIDLGSGRITRVCVVGRASQFTNGTDLSIHMARILLAGVDESIVSHFAENHLRPFLYQLYL